jgi:putative transposase
MDIYRQHAHAHSVGWSTWHLEWCTKYRYKIFVTQQQRQYCLIAIHEAAKRHNIRIIDAECDSDHVHVIVTLPLMMSPSKAAMLLKGLSARIIFLLLPHVRRLYRKGHLWSPGKFMASVGYITLDKAKKYLEEHHAKQCHFLINRNPCREAGAAAAASLQAREDVKSISSVYRGFSRKKLLN